MTARYTGGSAVLDQNGDVSLDSGKPLFEYAPLLAEMLEPYPEVQIVLTTSWLDKLPLEQVTRPSFWRSRALPPTTPESAAVHSHHQCHVGRRAERDAAPD